MASAATNEAESILETALLKAHHDELPNAQALDPISIISFISGIIELIRNCRNQSAARSHIQRGSAVAYRATFNRLRDEGYNRNDARKLALNLVKQSQELSESQVNAIVEEAGDVPVEPQQGFWPID